MLGYWRIRGLASQCRHILTYCGADYTEKRYDASQKEDGSWDMSDWTNEKETLGYEYPNLPYLQDGDVRITETAAIMKYVAKKYKPELLGRTAAELGRVEMLSAHVVTLKMKSTMPCYASDDRAPIIEECIPILAKLVEVQGSDLYIAGQNITYLDFFYVELLEFLDFLSEGKFYEEFPATKAYYDRLVSLPELKDYMADDERCPKKPFNGLMAKINNM